MDARRPVSTGQAVDVRGDPRRPVFGLPATRPARSSATTCSHARPRTPRRSPRWCVDELVHRHGVGRLHASSRRAVARRAGRCSVCGAVLSIRRPALASATTSRHRMGERLRPTSPTARPCLPAPRCTAVDCGYQHPRQWCRFIIQMMNSATARSLRFSACTVGPTDEVRRLPDPPPCRPTCSTTDGGVGAGVGHRAVVALLDRGERRRVARRPEGPALAPDSSATAPTTHRRVVHDLHRDGLSSPSTSSSGA